MARFWRSPLSPGIVKRSSLAYPHDLPEDTGHRLVWPERDRRWWSWAKETPGWLSTYPGVSALCVALRAQAMATWQSPHTRFSPGLPHAAALQSGQTNLARVGAALGPWERLSRPSPAPELVQVPPGNVQTGLGIGLTSPAPAGRQQLRRTSHPRLCNGSFAGPSCRRQVVRGS